MMPSEAGAISQVSLLDPGAAANTAGATGGWVAAAVYEGDLVITQHVGVVTAGQIAGKLQDADDGSGTNPADVSGATFVVVTTSNDPLIQKMVIPAGSVRPYVRYVGTITTGPVGVGVIMSGRPKEV